VALAVYVEIKSLVSVGTSKDATIVPRRIGIDSAGIIDSVKAKIEAGPTCLQQPYFRRLNPGGARRSYRGCGKTYDISETFPRSSISAISIPAACARLAVLCAP
jgi:hypothetical protein